jgi:hypothetical protein
MSWAAVAGAAVSVVGGALSSKSSGQQTSTKQNQLNPGMQELLYGDGTKGGLLSQNLSYLNAQKLPGLEQFGNYTSAYLQNEAPYDMGQVQQTAKALATSNGVAPQIQAARGNFTNPFNVAQSAFPGGNQGPQTANANTANVSLINAPSQNGLNLNPALNNIVYGDLGNNDYLAGSIQKGLNQSNASFQNMMADATQNFNENIIPGIRGDAIVNNTLGGSRQGIAEGKAGSEFAKQIARTASQVAQNQTDAAVQAQANQFNQDRQNQLNAAMGLSGQQYGVAGQNAGYQNQNALANAGMLNSMGQFNAGVGNNYLGQLLQNNQFNANAQNANNAMQYGGNQQMNLANLGYQQGTNQFNAGNTMNMAELNSRNKAVGAGLLSGQVNQIYGYGNNANDADINRATKVNSIISPYSGLGGSQISSQPLYQNQAANAVGGALSGLQLYNQFGGGNSGGSYTPTYNQAPAAPNFGNFNQPVTNNVSNLFGSGGY